MKAKFPIASKFIGGFVIILLSISAFLFFYFPKNMRETLIEKETINAEVLIDVVSVGAGLALAAGDFEVLGLTIKIAKQFPNAQYILFFDAENEQVAEFNPTNISVDTSYALLRNGILLLEDKMIIRSPLVHDNQVYGSLILNYSLSSTNDTIIYYRKLIAQLSLLILLLGTLVAIALSRIATNSIRKLMEASNKVISGDLGAAVKISSKDEFGLLGNTFNFMLQSIRENSQIEAINEELRNQQQALELKNVELEEQSDRMKEQQNELESSNEELTNQKEAVAEKNRLLKKSSESLLEKAQQLEKSNRFKSEFLANMSHELRSPLNSMLILANDLAENETKNLTVDQVESADIIYSGGKELLTLINDILDLSKIESGKMEVLKEKFSIRDLARDVQKRYQHMANQKGLAFEVEVMNNVPNKVNSDEQRINQIVNNLISNAIKFTESGTVSLQFYADDKDYFKIVVADTGIGIPKEKQQLVFNAFTQADGGTTRKYGGTGLGLAITTKLIEILKGEINLESEEGNGSTFTVKLPVNSAEKSTLLPPVIEGNKKLKVSKQDLDQNLILVIEDDERFAKVLKKEIVKMGYDVKTTALGIKGLELAKQWLPSAIILDLGLPDISGLEVLERLKANAVTQSIPVHVMSVSNPAEFKQLDVVQYITKPIDKEQLKNAFLKIANSRTQKLKKVLLLEDHKMTRDALKKVLNIDNLEIIETALLSEAISAVETLDYLDGVILDLKLPDGSGKDLLEILQQRFGKQIPHVIVYTGKEMNETEVNEINEWAQSIIIKGEKSENRLIEEMSLFLNFTHEKNDKSEIIIPVSKSEKFLNKTALVVDDDMRNVFALSKMLVNRGFKVTKASNGKKALAALEKENTIDIVLMDIMMPEMDGYEAMKRIRAMEQYETLPIIALTAKAMKDDKEKCIQAGANDYMSKPIDIDMLINLMGVWIK